MLRTAVVVFLAAAAGVILFTTIQDDLPPELSILKNSGTYGPGGPAKDLLGGPLPAKAYQSYQGWAIHSDDNKVVMSRALQRVGESESGVDSAHLYYSCSGDGASLYIIPLAGGKPLKKPMSVGVSLSGGGSSNWKMTQGRLFAQEASYILPVMIGKSPQRFTLDAPINAEFALDTAALPSITQNLPAACK